MPCRSRRLQHLAGAAGRKGLSQEQLAEELGISRQHMASIEAPNMDRGLSLELFFNIATVLEVEPYQLLKFRPERE